MQTFDHFQANVYFRTESGLVCLEDSSEGYKVLLLFCQVFQMYHKSLHMHCRRAIKLPINNQTCIVHGVYILWLVCTGSCCWPLLLRNFFCSTEFSIKSDFFPYCLPCDSYLPVGFYTHSLSAFPYLLLIYFLLSSYRSDHAFLSALTVLLGNHVMAVICLRIGRATVVISCRLVFLITCCIYK